GPGRLSVPPAIVELIPESVARENIIMPLSADGETITVAAVNAGDVMLADKLGFILNRKVRLVPKPRYIISEAIKRHYGETETVSVDSMLAEFTDSAGALSESEEFELALDDASCEVAAKPPAAPARSRSNWLRLPKAGSLGKGLVEFKKGLKGRDDKPTRGNDRTT